MLPPVVDQLTRRSSSESLPSLAVSKEGCPVRQAEIRDKRDCPQTVHAFIEQVCCSNMVGGQARPPVWW